MHPQPGEPPQEHEQRQEREPRPPSSTPCCRNSLCAQRASGSRIAVGLTSWNRPGPTPPGCAAMICSDSCHSTSRRSVSARTTDRRPARVDSRRPGPPCRRASRRTACATATIDDAHPRAPPNADQRDGDHEEAQHRRPPNRSRPRSRTDTRSDDRRGPAATTAAPTRRPSAPRSPPGRRTRRSRSGTRTARRAARRRSAAPTRPPRLPRSPRPRPGTIARWTQAQEPPRDQRGRGTAGSAPPPVPGRRPAARPRASRPTYEQQEQQPRRRPGSTACRRATGHTRGGLARRCVELVELTDRRADDRPAGSRSAPGTAGRAARARGPAGRSSRSSSTRR